MKSETLIFTFSNHFPKSTKLINYQFCDFSRSLFLSDGKFVASISSVQSDLTDKWTSKQLCFCCASVSLVMHQTFFLSFLSKMKEVLCNLSINTEAKSKKNVIRGTSSQSSSLTLLRWLKRKSNRLKSKTVWKKKCDLITSLHSNQTSFRSLSHVSHSPEINHKNVRAEKWVSSRPALVFDYNEGKLLETCVKNSFRFIDDDDECSKLEMCRE